MIEAAIEHFSNRLLIVPETLLAVRKVKQTIWLASELLYCDASMNRGASSELKLLTY